MSYNPVCLVGLLQPFHIIIRELNVKRTDRFLKMLDFGSADDRRVHALVQQPRKRYLGSCHSLLLRDLINAFDNVKVFGTEEPLREILVSLVSRRARRLSTLVSSCQESSCQGAPRDQAYSLILAKWNHLSFFFSIA